MFLRRSLNLKLFYLPLLQMLLKKIHQVILIVLDFTTFLEGEKKSNYISEPLFLKLEVHSFSFRIFSHLKREKLQALLLICVFHEVHQLYCHLTAACSLFLFIYIVWKTIAVPFHSASGRNKRSMCYFWKEPHGLNLPSRKIILIRLLRVGTTWHSAVMK